MPYPLPAVVTTNGTALALASRTATTTTADLTNLYGRGGHVTLTMATCTAATATLSIQGKDVASGSYYTILTGAAISSVSTTTYQVYPGSSAVANSIVNNIIPQDWRISIAQGGTCAYSVGYSLVP